MFNNFPDRKRLPQQRAWGLGRIGLGDPSTDGTAQAVVALDGTPALCTAGNAAVMAFQSSFNAALAAGSYATVVPLPTALTVDGQYGSATMTALQVASGSPAVPQACTSFTGAPAATPSPAAGTVTLPTQTIVGGSGSSTSTLLIGGLVLAAAGAAAIWYYRGHHATGHGAPSAAHLRGGRTSRHPRAAARQAARRRRR
jgi:hypothetical protein